MKKKFTAGTLFLVLIFFISSCKKDKAPVNEEELITTVALRFTEAGTTNQSTFIFRDLDGEGGNAPSVFEGIQLGAGKTYNLSIIMLNETVSPADSISNEIVNEAVDHQFYFQPSGVAVNISNLNNDPLGLPLGITSTWTTGVAGNGTVRITLKHKPGLKSAGDPITVGDTDVELDWPVTIL